MCFALTRFSLEARASEVAAFEAAQHKLAKHLRRPMPKFAASMLDTPCSTGFPPLCIAAARNDFRAVDILLKAGAAPNVRCESIVTGAKSAVHFVVSVGGGAPGTAVMCVCVSLTVVRKFLSALFWPAYGRHAMSMVSAPCTGQPRGASASAFDCLSTPGLLRN